MSSSAVSVLPCTVCDIEFLALNLHSLDRLEVCRFGNIDESGFCFLEELMSAFNESDLNYSVFIDGELCGCFGFGWYPNFSPLSSTRNLWWLRTEKMKQHRLTFVKHFKRVIDNAMKNDILMGVDSLDVNVWEHHVEAIRLLERSLSAVVVRDCVLFNGDRVFTYRITI